MTELYLDNASTTPLDPAVFEAMLPFLREEYGNPSSIHRFGRRARVAVEEAREHVAALFDADLSEIVFTSGGTEADNAALHAAWRIAGTKGRSRVLSSQAEHQAVLRSIEHLGRDGAESVFVPVTARASVHVDAAIDSMDETLALAAFMHVNNETGGINPIARLSEAAKERGAMFHTDAVQSAGKLPLSSKAIPYDFAAASAHKLHGPKGIGALFVRRGIDFAPFIAGGAQERGRRGGTESVAVIVGFGAAARLALEQREERLARWSLLRDALLCTIRELHPACVVNGDDADALPSIVSVSFPSQAFPLDGEALVMQLDIEGVAVSSGSACTAGSIEASHVMRAIGHDRATSEATIRFSFGASTSLDDVMKGAAAVNAVVSRMLQAGGTSRSAMP